MNAAIEAKAKAARERLDVHTREIVEWHFNPATGCPFWLNKAKEWGIDVRKEVQRFDDLKKLNEEQKDLPIDGREPDIAAFVILDALSKMNWVCELALAYPKHKDLHRTAMAMLGTNGVVLDFIFDAEHAKRPIFDATPSVELYRNFPSISAFYDRVLGG